MTQLNKLLEYAYKCDRKKGEWLTIRMPNSNRTFTSRSPRYLYMGHHLGTWQEDARLYESWRCIMKRKEMPYEETKILNAALVRYIVSGCKPDVDLRAVYKDMHRGTKLEEVEKRIGRGDHALRTYH